MTTYYTEYPKGEFQATSDELALFMTKALVVYRENDDVTINDDPFVVIRDYVAKAEAGYDPFKTGLTYTHGDPGL